MLTEQEQKTLDLYLKLGSKAAVARELGVNESTVRQSLLRADAKEVVPTGQERVLVIGDTHAPAMHKDYIAFLKKIHKKHKCTRVVHIGDLVDWCALSFHEKEAFMPNPVDEFKQAQQQVRALHAAFPRADLLIGNHDSLPSRQAAKLGLPDEVLRGFDRLWELDGWTIHPRYADLVIDNVVYRHGDKGKGGIMAAYKNAIAEFRSVVQGHLHAQAGIVYHANQDECVFGMQVGCGVDHKHPAMNYGRVYAAKPILGCGVVYSSKLAFVEPMFL